MVGAGAVVTKDVPPRAIVVGNPAHIIGYVDANLVEFREYTPKDVTSNNLNVRGASLVELPEIADLRGNLSFAEIGNGLPFAPQRYFLIYGVPTREVRGEHAHRTLHQFLVCVQGGVSVVVDDGRLRQEIRLSRPTLGLHIAPMVWAVQYRYSEDAVLLVFASAKYDANDYIRDYAEFLKTISRKSEEEG